jgi:hypothetical protein
MDSLYVIYIEQDIIKLIIFETKLQTKYEKYKN